MPGFNGNIVGGLHDFQPMAERAAAAGLAVLLPCMRTASDFSDRRFEDCAADIGAALDAAAAREFDRFAPFGTSLGGPRAVHNLKETQDPRVAAFGFIASIMSP